MVGPIRASFLPAFWPSQSTCRFRPMTWTPSDTTDAIQSVVGLALSFANDGLLQFARGGSLMETVYQNCTTGRSNLFESHRQRRWLTVVSYVGFGSMAVIAAGGVALLTTSIQAQQRGGTVETDRVQPVNSGEHPYRVIRDWAQLDLEARPWGGSNGVAVDRCPPGTTPGCADSPANPVHHFDESGNAIRSFGGGMFLWPHGIHVDRDGNVWVADARADGNKGSAVVKSLCLHQNRQAELVRLVLPQPSGIAPPPASATRRSPTSGSVRPTIRATPRRASSSPRRTATDVARSPSRLAVTGS